MKTINSKHKVAIFCGSMFGSKKEYKDIAVKVTEYLSRNRYDIVYGGGENGLMGVVANTALKNKAHVTGIIPNFLDNRETIHKKIDKIIDLVKSKSSFKVTLGGCLIKKVNGTLILSKE